MIWLILGILCLIYYAACVRYSGFRTSFLWIWLAGGLALSVFGGYQTYRRVNGLDPILPAAVRWAWRIVFLALVLLFLYLLSRIASGMRQKGKEELDYIIVLGCQVKGKRPSRSMMERIRTAAVYLNKNPETVAILSGGQGTGEEITEAACMAKVLMAKGIPEDRIILEDTSTTTVENLKNSSTFLDLRKDSVGLVTNNFHIYRSVKIAERLGYQDVCGIAAPSNTLLQPHYLVRESLAILKAYVQQVI